MKNDDLGKIPSIRFKGFTNAWEPRRLSDAVDNVGTGSSKYVLQEASDLAKYEVLGSTSVIGYDEDYDHEGDFILTARVGANAGDLYHHSGKVKITDNTVFIQGENLVFVYNLLTQFDLKKLSFGTGQPLIKASELKSLILYFPNNDEQVKIGSFFKTLDNLIALHQRELDKTKELKKTMLSKMFPKNGEDKPEVRFSGFTDAWELRSLWELTAWDKKFNEVDRNKQSEIKSYKYLLANQIAEIEDSSGEVSILATGNYEGFTTKEKAGEYLSWGEIVAIPWGGTANIKYTKGFFVTADNRIATSINLDVLKNKFLYYFMNNRISELSSYYRGASIQHPSMNDVLNMRIVFPNIEEQDRISEILSLFDNLITLHQRELEKLKNIKKTLLKHMFV